MKTKAEYEAYKQAVADFHKRENLREGLNGAIYNEQGNAPDPFFSWRPCGCCGSRLGGDRETYRFVTDTNDTIEADICFDCVYYLAYGKLDDATMAEIEP